MSDFVLETSRLILRKFTESDLEALIPIMGDAEVQKFSPFGCEDRDGIRKFLDGVRLRDSRDGVTQYAITLKDSGELIGDCGIMIQRIDDIPEFEIGYKLGRKHWGKGFATEAAAACREYGVSEKKIHRFISIIDSLNVASVRVAKRIGMTLEKKSHFKGSYVDLYSLNIQTPRS